MKFGLFLLFMGTFPILWHKAVDSKEEDQESINPRLKVINYYLPALELEGKAYRGKETFRERCAFCHKATARGYSFGPNVSTLKEKGKVYIMTNLLDPSSFVLPGFEAVEVETKNEIVRGMISEKTDNLITLKLPLGQVQRIPKEEIKRLEKVKGSIMPNNLDSGLSHQDMADLLEYLMTQ